MLWRTERGSRMCPQSLDQVFARLGAEAELTAHCLRHSYVTHQF
jgi:integrase/recombinase XerC